MKFYGAIIGSQSFVNSCNGSLFQRQTSYFINSCEEICLISSIQSWTVSNLSLTIQYFKAVLCSDILRVHLLYHIPVTDFWQLTSLDTRSIFVFKPHKIVIQNSFSFVQHKLHSNPSQIRILERVTSPHEQRRSKVPFTLGQKYNCHLLPTIS